MAADKMLVGTGKARSAAQVTEVLHTKQRVTVTRVTGTELDRDENR
jgi:hypothetical protein